MTDLFNNNGAEFSEDRKYRYALWRIWDSSLPLIMFIGLNPSTANESSDDPTIRRVKSMAKQWNYGGVYMMNLFAFVTPYPEELKKCDNPLGDNNGWLEKIAAKCELVICAWGAFDVMGRDKEVMRMFPDAHALIINKDGSPRHPLYVPSSVRPIKYSIHFT